MFILSPYIERCVNNKKEKTPRDPWVISLTRETVPQSIHTFAPSCDDTITLIKRKKSLSPLWVSNGPIILLKKLYSLYPRMLCAKFVWNWPNGSKEDDFKISLMCFPYFVSISSWKRSQHFIWTKSNSPCSLNPLLPRMIFAMFGWNWPSGSSKFCSCIFTSSLDSPLRKVERT